jgi:hypothetical protein
MDTTMDANQNVASIAIVPGQLYHVLLPRNSRNTMEVSFPNKMLVPDITEVIKSALQDTYKTSNILILKAEYLKHYFNEETLSNSYTYAIIYLNIPKEVFKLLRQNNISRCKFYVGLSEENTCEMPVLNNRPYITDMAITSREGNAYPYETEIVLVDNE